MKVVYLYAETSGQSTAVKVTETKSVVATLTQTGARLHIEAIEDISETTKSRLGNGYSISTEEQYCHQLSAVLEGLN